MRTTYPIGDQKQSCRRPPVSKRRRPLVRLMVRLRHKRRSLRIAHKIVLAGMVFLVLFFTIVSVDAFALKHLQTDLTVYLAFESDMEQVDALLEDMLASRAAAMAVIANRPDATEPTLFNDTVGKAELRLEEIGKTSLTSEETVRISPVRTRLADYRNSFSRVLMLRDLSEEIRSLSYAMALDQIETDLSRGIGAARDAGNGELLLYLTMIAEQIDQPESMLIQPLFGFGVGYRVLSDDTNGRAILASLSLLKAVRERIDMLDTKLELEVAAFFGTQTTLAENAIHTLRNAVRAGRDRRANNLLTGLKSAFIGSASLAGAMLGIVLALFVIISRQVLVPVARMRRMMNSISSGKLQTRLPSSRRHDEIGEMMSAIRVFKSTAIEADRLQREMSLHKSRDKANASGVARTQFLAAMSHELRTPLNAVIGFSDVMSKEMFGNIGNERYKDYAEQIHTSGQHLLSLVEDILDVSQFDLKAAKLDQSEFDPAQVLSESLRMIEQQAEKNNITIVSEIPTDLPAFIADRRRIKQVVVNLLTNAVKYNRPGGSVGLFASVNNDGLRLRITDTGIGMKRDELKKICEPFVQVAPTHTRTRDGVGLGLYLCRQMIDMHNGKLEIESEPGVGTSVTVTFPITRLKLAA